MNQETIVLLQLQTVLLIPNKKKAWQCCRWTMPNYPHLESGADFKKRKNLNIKKNFTWLIRGGVS